MSVRADSTLFTADSTLVTADGYAPPVIIATAGVAAAAGKTATVTATAHSWVTPAASPITATGLVATVTATEHALVRATPAIVTIAGATANVGTTGHQASHALAGSITTTGRTPVVTGTTFYDLTLSPDGFVSASGIEDQAAGTTDLHLAIDDSPDASDGDTTYLVNAASQSGHAWVTLSNTPSDFGSMNSISVRVRARRA